MNRKLASLILIVSCAAASANAQDTIRVSVDPKGKEADSDSGTGGGCVATSGSKPLVVFSSVATNLVPNDLNDAQDVFLRDLATGITTRLSLDLNGQEADSESSEPRITPDGAYVVFKSLASDLVKGDKNAKFDVFVLDRAQNSIERVSVDESGKELASDSFLPRISDDGRYVAFTTVAAAVAADGNGFKDVFVRDRVAGVTLCASLTPAGGTGNHFSDSPSIASAGLVAFSSFASDLVPNDTNGVSDVFVRDLVAGTTIRVSVNEGGVEADDDCFQPSLADDGHLLAFQTGATNLHRGSTNGTSQILVRDLADGTTWLASRGIDGLAANDFAGSPLLFQRTDAWGSRWLVAFTSTATNLHDDGGADRDVFVVDFVAGVGQCATVDSAGVDDADHHSATHLGVSADGDAVLFSSFGDELVPGDTGATFDVFMRGLQWARPLEFGVGLAGAGGHVPHLSGEGGACEAGRFSIAIADGIGQAAGHLWIGFGRTSGLPLFGGTFYVDFLPAILALPILLDGPAGLAGAGSLELAGVEVGDVGPLSIYLQCTFLDPKAPKGVSLTNALEITLDT